MTTGNFLPELNITQPQGSGPKSLGDDYLRELARCLIGDGTAGSGSFTPNFTGQYTGTAAQLEAAVDKYLTGYNIGELGDVSVVGRADGDVLIFNDATDTWEAGPQTGQSGSVLSRAYSSRYGDAIIKLDDRLAWPSIYEANIPTTLANIFPNSARGLQYQVVKAHDVTMTWSVNMSAPDTVGRWSVIGTTGIGTGSTAPFGADRLEQAASCCDKTLVGFDLRFGFNIAVRLRVTAGQELGTYLERIIGPASVISSSRLNITAREIENE